MKRFAIIAALLIVAGLFAWVGARSFVADKRTAPDAASSEDFGENRGSGASPGTAGGRRYPSARRDQAKRDELRARILAAAAVAVAEAKAEKAAAAAQGTAARGNRETDDIQEFGRFAAQAIREDFIPMARACAQDLHRRKPDAGGSAKIAFELLGDKKIGGVVSSAEIVNEHSSIHDTEFETCMRESMYGVYFDPPPANVRATLSFDVTVLDDGGVDDAVEDFHPRDRRDE